jgi:hypothetical protein
MNFACKTTILSILMISSLSLSANASTQDVYEEAYKFASSPTGLYLARKEAMSVALEIASRPNPASVLSAYQGACRFASAPTGLYLDRKEAMSYAMETVNLAQKKDEL